MKPLAALLAALIVTGLGQALAADDEFAPRIYATRADGSPAWELDALKEHTCAQFPELSPNGTYVALGGWKAGQCDLDSHVLLVNLNDGTVEDAGPGGMPSWSPDGTMIAYITYGRNHGIHVRPVQGGFEELIDTEGWGIQWSPDGKRLAFVRGGNLVIYDLATESKRPVFPEQEAVPYQQIDQNLSWSPDSQRLCFKGQRRSEAPGARRVREVVVVSVNGDPQLRVCAGAADAGDDVAWHPDGRRIVILKAGELYEIDPDTKNPPRRLSGLPVDRTNSGLCWSRDGEILVFISQRPRQRFGRMILDVF